MQAQGFGVEAITTGLAEEEDQTGSHEDVPSTSTPQAQGKKNPPEQRRRVMSDRFMMFTYKIKMCKRQDLHNWRLCPYAHPGEAGKRRPPHAYQAVMCDFSKPRKECSHGEACLLARNALEYWLHPDKYRTILCGHGEACNRNICFFAHNQQELRMPASRSSGTLGLGGDSAAAAAEAFQQLSLAHPGAGSSSQTAAGQQLMYAPDLSAGGTVFQAAAVGSMQQPMQAVYVADAGGRAQQMQMQVPVQVPVQVAVAAEQHQAPVDAAAGLAVMPTAPGLQQVQYQQQAAAGSTGQVGTGAPPGLIAAGTAQSGIAPVGHPYIQGQPQLVQQPQSQHEQPGIAGQGIAAGSSNYPGGQVLLQQQPLIPVQGWGDAAAHYQGNMDDGGGLARMPFYGVHMAALHPAGQLIIPAMQQQQRQQQLPHVQQAQNIYYHPQQPQMVLYTPANPGVAASADSLGGGAVGFAPSNAGRQQVQILLSQQPSTTQLAPAAFHAGSGVIQVPPLQQAGGLVPPPTSASVDPASHYGAPQQW